MKAIRYQAAGQPEWVEVPEPQAAPGQVLLQVEAVTTCPQWDLHLMDGVSMAPGGAIEYPTPVGHPGHEAVGRVVARGDGAVRFSVGQRVALWRDQGPGRDGCYAQYVAADEAALLAVPEGLRAEQIASLELAMCLQVSFDQILKVKPIAGTRFGVSGLGPAGLVAVQLAAAYGAREVVAFDPVPARREAARELGAELCLDPLEAQSFPEDRFSDAAIDVAVDCAGLGASVEYLMRRTRDAVACFGVLREEVRFGFFHWCRGLHLIGYGNQTKSAAERALAHVESGALHLDALVSETMPLSDYAAGVEKLRKREAIKVCFVP